MIVVATDAPVDARQLRRLAARAPMGLARAGASSSSGSGALSRMTLRSSWPLMYSITM